LSTRQRTKARTVDLPSRNKAAPRLACSAPP